MPTYSAPDGTRLAYRDLGEGDGDPVVCVPGGPTDSRYLGDLGGLSGHRRLALADLPGTGRSATPDDPASYRCDRLVGDIEALPSTSAWTGSTCSATPRAPTSPRSTRPATRTGCAASP